ncbi:DNA/RNA nuclease SfsA [Pelagibaculum spongiae]|nr:DNA/RNA nuclease SfsA [Pelagibaculum spongiae]
MQFDSSSVENSLSKMRLPDLLAATLVKRYKRFLADMILPNGEQITVHCPNTGTMKHCGKQGDKCWLSVSDNPKRKYAHTWELVETDNGGGIETICINTARANQVVAAALEKKLINGLDQYQQTRKEVKDGDKSRIDFLLSESSSGQPNCWLEVKSATLQESDGKGYFPDAVTDRGLKHLKSLTDKVAQGDRAGLLFCVMHSGIDQVSPAQHIDPKYYQGFQQALAAGVECWALSVIPQVDGLYIKGLLPVVAEGQLVATK